MNSVFLILSSVIYFQSSYFVLNYINENVNKPYMDEIFHIPQAQQYCLGNYNDWNDKITTLPGLYLITTSIIRVIGILLKDEENILKNICNVNNLRLFNVFMSTLVFIIVYKIFLITSSKKLANSTNSTFVSILSAFSICLFPLNYFFQYLYYTDIGSTLFVLIAYYQLLVKNYKLSAASGAIAIAFRQTNVVWVVFCMLLLFLSNIENVISNQESKQSAKQTKDINVIYHQRVKKHSYIFELLCHTPNEAFGKDFELVKFFNRIYREDLWGKKMFWTDLAHVLDTATSQMQSYLIIILTFIFFVYANNGIVVGDKSNHQASFHLCQLFYFYSFSCFFSFSSFLFNIKKIRNLFTFINRNIRLIFILALPVMCLIIHNFTYEHPFLLADNRHYTFYIWSRLYKRHELIKYVLSFIYLTCIYLFYRNLTMTGKTVGWLLAYTVCLFVCLIPQKLIEFRYFIIPYFIYRLNINQISAKEILVEFIFNCGLNILTIYIFLNKTFLWPDNSDVQRFMW